MVAHARTATGPISAPAPRATPDSTARIWYGGATLLRVKTGANAGKPTTCIAASVTAAGPDCIVTSPMSLARLPLHSEVWTSIVSAGILVLVVTLGTPTTACVSPDIREATARSRWTSVPPIHVRMEPPVQTTWEATPVSVLLATMGLTVQRKLMSATLTPAKMEEPALTLSTPTNAPVLEAPKAFTVKLISMTATPCMRLPTKSPSASMGASV